MQATALDIQGVYLIKPTVHGDARGWFYESFSQAACAAIGIAGPFVQDNRSYSAKRGTLRGLHCQAEPKTQGKLFSCTRGRILDVAVDARRDSPTYLKWVSAELSAENKCQLWIPRGCLHGFVTLTDDVEVFYKVDAPYSAAHDRSVRWDDPAFGVAWGIKRPILSAKDSTALLWNDTGLEFRL
jgi:dTDP-4-dehydrorhamnose 3,5-epimerase